MTVDEKGVIICSYSKEAVKPVLPIRYAEECMTGFEYAAADNMLQCGMEDEAVEIVEAIRDRYDGCKRNPWSEQECGASYARAMASYSFLLTYSGFRYDMTEKMIGFKPIHEGCYFWSIDGAWGMVSVEADEVLLKVLYGKIDLRKFIHSLRTVKCILIDGIEQQFKEIAEDMISIHADLYADMEMTIETNM